jgi:hypothetical protein
LFINTEKFKNVNDSANLTTFLNNVGFYVWLQKHAKSTKANPEKLQKNVERLLEMAELFNSLEDFYDHIALFSSESP